MPALTLLVDLASPVPPYEQVRTQVAAHVSAGRLRPGDRLPTVRALAADLGIAVGTVARAYRELEAGGLVTSRRRAGTVVTAGAGREQAGPEAAASTAQVLAAATAVVELGRAAGWSDEEVLTAVRGALLAPSGGRAGVSSS
jgi:GntR family transcriptional regulator